MAYPPLAPHHSAGSGSGAGSQGKVQDQHSSPSVYRPEQHVNMISFDSRSYFPPPSRSRPGTLRKQISTVSQDEDVNTTQLLTPLSNNDASVYSSPLSHQQQQLAKPHSTHSVSTHRRSNTSLNTIGRKQADFTNLDCHASSYSIVPLRPPSLNFSKRQRKFCCGCFRTRCGCCSFWWSIVLLLLGGLAAAGWFIYPRIPTISVDLSSASPNVLYAGHAANASVTHPFSMSASVNLSITVNSSNYIDWDLDYVNLVVRNRELR